MVLNMDLVRLSGWLNHQRKTPSASLIDVCFGSLRAALLKGISTRRPACGMVITDDA